MEVAATSKLEPSHSLTPWVDSEQSTAGRAACPGRITGTEPPCLPPPRKPAGGGDVGFPGSISEVLVSAHPVVSGVLVPACLPPQSLLGLPLHPAVSPVTGRTCLDQLPLGVFAGPAQAVTDSPVRFWSVDPLRRTHHRFSADLLPAALPHTPTALHLRLHPDAFSAPSSVCSFQGTPDGTRQLSAAPASCACSYLPF